jgi:hypothetical protein
MELGYLSTGGIIAGVLRQFLPVWIGMALILGVSFAWRRKLGLYGQIFGSGIGVIGLALVVFWLLSALMADWVGVFGPYEQIRALQNKAPGAIDPTSGLAYLSEVVHRGGSRRAIGSLMSVPAVYGGVSARGRAPRRPVQGRTARA